MSESRGLTLRKKKTQKRPVISAPQQTTRGPISAPTDRPNLAVPRERPAQSETSDLIKRRYSTRYNQLPQFGANEVPDVPSLPPAAGTLKRRSQGASPSRPSSSHSAHPLKVDQSILADPNLQHERYVADLLSNASEGEIQEYQGNLQRLKKRASLDMKKNVFQNRTQFIKISKEAEKLNQEMTVLKSLMSELTTSLEQSSAIVNPSSITNDSTARARKAANRSSVANLEAMWSTQLQTLWKSVEKSQKFLPATPGRHVVMENGQWIELDSATWKPKRPVHIVLLNDHLLVASKKRKKVDPNLPQSGPAPTKQVAEECWPLGDIDVIDMATTVSNDNNAAAEKAIASAVIIRCGSKTWTYRHEKRDQAAKMQLFTVIRKTQEDLRKANLPKPISPVAEDTNPRSPDLTMNGGLSPNLNNEPMTLASKKTPDVLIEIDGKPQPLRVIDALLDELDIDIALQEHEPAVLKVEKLRTIAASLFPTPTNPNSASALSGSKKLAHTHIITRTAERAATLASTLLRELMDTHSFLEATRRSTSFLIRLGFEDRAREAYLSARSDALTRQTRGCVFTGDLRRWVFSTSYVNFVTVRNTVSVYRECFASGTTAHGNAAMSACVGWAGGHLEGFNRALRRQLDEKVVDAGLRREMMDVVWGLERQVLGEAGLDFREVVGRDLK